MVACAAGCERAEVAAPASDVPAQPVAVVPQRFVGSTRCGGCHTEAYTAWRESHHAKAMQPATPTTLLGDFEDRTLMAGSVETRFFRRDGRAQVRTDGPDGALHDYEVAFAFGIDPLQQLLLPLDRGRLQATTVAWDARPKQDGGQRWFSVPGNERIPPSDPLHWTQLAQNWNASCAECHSTDVRKGFELGPDRWNTTWSEISVGCEACHGPGAVHVAWAERSPESLEADAGAHGLEVAFARDASAWAFAPNASIASRIEPRRADPEIDACGRCHARRGVVADPYDYGRPLLDTHRPALLEAGLYTDDGQIEDEVYEWGSFLQSRMHAAGVVCGDCHEPHGAKLRAEGNAVCAQCHRTEVFDARSHHHHEPDSAAARCVSCHMPTRVYMQVDARHDHSLRVPRPDLGEKLGTRDACTACHADRKPTWAAAAIVDWFGETRRREPHFGEALHAARTGAVGGGDALVALANDPAQPAIARATALAELAAWPLPSAGGALVRAAGSPDPLLRLGAIVGARSLDPATQVATFSQLLRDPIRTLRVDAASLLVATPAELWSPADRSVLADALAEWRAAQMANAERPEAHVNLGAVHAQLGERDAARAQYETALRLGPWFVPAYLNLADLLREEGRDEEGERLLRRALEIAPESADAHHALGLLLVRSDRKAAAVVELARAAELAPASLAYTWVWAVALHSTGDSQRAIEVLEAFRARRPGDLQVAGLIEQLRAEAPVR